MTARYAIYFSPADATDLAQFGAAVLGRDANSYKNRKSPSGSTATAIKPFRNSALEQGNTTKPRKAALDSPASVEPFADEALWLRYTEKPAHYGFHATIKAPFELAADCTAAELLDELSTFSASRSTLALPDLMPTKLGAFTALAMPEQPQELIDLATEVVIHFESFRQELSAFDVKRRQTHTLSASEIDNLEHYGYPYIFADFQFHMTLSAALPSQESRYLPWVQSVYRKLVSHPPRLIDCASFVKLTEHLLLSELPSFD